METKSSEVLALEIANFFIKSKVSKETIYSLSENHELMFDILKNMGDGRTRIYSPLKDRNVGASYHTVDTVMIICENNEDNKILDELYSNYERMVNEMIKFKNVVIVSNTIKSFGKPALVTTKQIGDVVVSVNHY